MVGNDSADRKILIKIHSLLMKSKSISYRSPKIIANIDWGDSDSIGPALNTDDECLRGRENRSGKKNSTSKDAERKRRKVKKINANKLKHELKNECLGHFEDECDFYRTLQRAAWECEEAIRIPVKFIPTQKLIQVVISFCPSLKRLSNLMRTAGRHSRCSERDPIGGRVAIPWDTVR